MLTGPEGSLWLRYERMHEAAFHRAYKALLTGEEESETTSAPAAPKGANEFPEAPGPDEWSCPCGTPDPMEVPVDSCMFCEVGPVLSAEATEAEAATVPASDPAPNEATKDPKSEGFDGPSAFGTLVGPDFVAFGSPVSTLVPGSEALGGDARVVAPGS